MRTDAIFRRDTGGVQARRRGVSGLLHCDRHERSLLHIFRALTPSHGRVQTSEAARPALRADELLAARIPTNRHREGEPTARTAQPHSRDALPTLICPGGLGCRVAVRERCLPRSAPHDRGTTRGTYSRRAVRHHESQFRASRGLANHDEPGGEDETRAELVETSSVLTSFSASPRRTRCPSAACGRSYCSSHPAATRASALVPLRQRDRQRGCACRPPRIGPPASTSATPVTAA